MYVSRLGVVAIRQLSVGWMDNVCYGSVPWYEEVCVSSHAGFGCSESMYVYAVGRSAAQSIHTWHSEIVSSFFTRTHHLSRRREKGAGVGHICSQMDVESEEEGRVGCIGNTYGYVPVERRSTASCPASAAPRETAARSHCCYCCCCCSSQRSSASSAPPPPPPALSSSPLHSPPYFPAPTNAFSAAPSSSTSLSLSLPLSHTHTLQSLHAIPFLLQHLSLSLSLSLSLTHTRLPCLLLHPLLRLHLSHEFTADSRATFRASLSLGLHARVALAQRGRELIDMFGRRTATSGVRRGGGGGAGNGDDEERSGLTRGLLDDDDENYEDAQELDIGRRRRREEEEGRGGVDGNVNEEEEGRTTWWRRKTQKVTSVKRESRSPARTPRTKTRRGRDRKFVGTEPSGENAPSSAVATPSGEEKKRPPSFKFATENQQQQQQQEQEEEAPVEELACAEDASGFFNNLFFVWVGELIARGNSKPLEFDDLWALSKRDQSRAVGSSFRKVLNAKKKRTPTNTETGADGARAARGSRSGSAEAGGAYTKTEVRLFASLYAAYGGWFWRAGAIKLVHDLVQAAVPMILRVLLSKLDEAEAFTWGEGTKVCVLLASLLYITSAMQTLLVNQYFHSLFRLGMHAKTAIIIALYQKALRLSMAARTEAGSSNITNLMSNDATKIGDLPTYLHVVWSGPLQIIVTTVLLSIIVGVVPTICAFGSVCILIPMTAALGKVLSAMRKSMMVSTDARIKCAAEVVNGIKTIKLYAWEEPYESRVSDLRASEMAKIRKFILTGVGNMFLFSVNPVIVAVVVFSVFTARGGVLTPTIAFPTLALLNQLRFPLLMVPRQIVNVIQCKVALMRLQEFLSTGETTKPPPAVSSVAPKGTVAMSDASFSWAGSEDTVNPTLRNVSLDIKPGQLCMIVGKVGSGKSSLLHALLGEMPCVGGASSVIGAVSYSAQDTWIRNASVKENIVFGSPFDEERYRMVLDCCCLEPDIAMLPAGDATEIGEKGVNLSGGQKHRVSLARSVYAETDVIMLDDPISAVDAHVGQKIMDSCICGILAKRTRILVTHHTQHARHADVVVILDQGRVKDYGSFDEVSSRNPEVLRMNPVKLSSNDLKSLDDTGAQTREAGAQRDEESQSSASTNEKLRRQTTSGSLGEEKGNDGAHAAKSKTTKSARKPASNIVVSEDRAKGKVASRVYRTYIREWSKRPFILPALVATLCVATQTCVTGRDYWLSRWSDESNASDGSFYLRVYAIIAFSGAILQGFNSLTMTVGTLRAADAIHQSLLHRIMRLPMSFFDSNPTGRIMNRFTKDTEDIDQLLPSTWNTVLLMSVQFVFSIVAICIVAPSVVVVVVPVLWIFKTIQQIYLMSSRELARLASVTRSPIFVHFGESVSGLTTIRAYGFQHESLSQACRLVDKNNRAYWPTMAVNRWLSCRLEILGHTITFITAISVAFFVSTSSGLSGFAISSSLNLTGMLNWLVRQLTQIETQMNSVERVLHYSTHETEAAPVVEGKRPPETWPSRGRIRVENLWLRYRDDLDPVLRGITFETRASEKVGIVGRTGCGKSTLMLALFRLVEPFSGSIIIDGVNCLSIGLRDLRSRLALVPQDPVLFSGTIRSNIDPFNNCESDMQLWVALDRSGIGDYVRTLSGHLDAKIEENGQNMSVGQRQMLCIARALLRDARVLILDEATSNVDNEGDEVIQTTIREEFKHCTVLTIAHRLHTIMDSDRIMVLDQGFVKEIGPPAVLVEKEGGILAGMVAKAAAE